MEKQYFEIVPYDVLVNTNAIANSYNTADKLMAIAQFMGYNPVLGDPCTAFNVRGTPANAYCQARMVSFVVATDLICTLSFGCYCTCAYNGGCNTHQIGSESNTKVYLYDLTLMISFIYVDGIQLDPIGNNKWNSAKVSIGSGYERSDTIPSIVAYDTTGEILNSQGVRGIYIYRGDNSVAIIGLNNNDNIHSEIGTYYKDTYNYYTYIFSKYINNNNYKFMLNCIYEYNNICYNVIGNGGIQSTKVNYSDITNQYYKNTNILVEGVIDNEDPSITQAINNFKFYASLENRLDCSIRGIRIINGEYYYCIGIPGNNKNKCYIAIRL